jgi:hypothetical protein
MATSTKILSIAFFVLVVQNAWAVCLNGHPSVEKEFEQRRTVFIGKVVSEKLEVPSDVFLDAPFERRSRLLRIQPWLAGAIVRSL